MALLVSQRGLPLPRRGGKGEHYMFRIAPCSAENSGTFFRRKKASASRHFLSTTGKLPERRPVLSRRGGKTAPCSVENSGTFSVGKRQVLHATPFPLPESCRREDRYFPAVAGKPLLALQRTPVLFPLGKRQVLHATPFPLPESCRREDRYFPAVTGKPLLAL